MEDCKKFKDRNGTYVRVGEEIQLVRVVPIFMEAGTERYKVVGIQRSGRYVEIRLSNGMIVFPPRIIKA